MENINLENKNTNFLEFNKKVEPWNLYKLIINIFL